MSNRDEAPADSAPTPSKIRPGDPVSSAMTCVISGPCLGADAQSEPAFYYFYILKSTYGGIEKSLSMVSSARQVRLPGRARVPARTLSMEAIMPAPAHLPATLTVCLRDFSCY